jgi:phosphoglycolate phosphatase-like HAD superfamily hydrolase
MPNPQYQLRNFVKRHDYFIAVDSDGCALDSMELKHKECFIPTLIDKWELQAVSKYAREAAEFVSLYSRWRGINRWPAIIKMFDLLRERDEVRRRGVQIPEIPGIREWIGRETKLSNDVLERELEHNPDPDLQRGLRWSQAANQRIDEVVRGVPAFPLVRESLAKLSQWADVIVCSVAPCAALEREWGAQDLSKYVRLIAGQEFGSKQEIIGLATAGRYERGKTLMIGDAPADNTAARANDALFYPINPGREEVSWKRFFEESSDKFLNGGYGAPYEAKLVAEFEALLPEEAPWKVRTQ